MLRIWFAVALGSALCCACGATAPAGVTCGPGTEVHGGVCVVTPLDGGVTCGVGTVVIGGMCVPDPSEARSCGTGTVQVGSVCVVLNADGGQSGDAGWFVYPPSIRIGPDGRWASYLEMTPSPDAGQRAFTSGAWKARNLVTDAEVVLDAARLIECTSGGCYYPVEITFGKGVDKAWVRRAVMPGTNGPAGELIDLGTGTKTPSASVNWYTNLVAVADDLKWGLFARQTYLSSPAALSYADSVTGPLQQLLTSCSDFGPIAVTTVAGHSYLATSTCTAGPSWSLQVWPFPTGVPVPISTDRATAILMAGSTLVYSAGTPAKSWVSSIAGEAPRALADGVVSSLSPNGTWVIVTPTGGEAVLLATASPATTQRLGVGAASFVWMDDDTVVYRTASEVRRATMGAAPNVVLDANAETVERIPGGVVVISAASTSMQLPVSDGHQTVSLTIRSLRSAWAVKGTSVTFMGKASVWSTGPTKSLKGKLYYDVLDNQRPADDNGFTFFATP